MSMSMSNIHKETIIIHSISLYKILFSCNKQSKIVNLNDYIMSNILDLKYLYKIRRELIENYIKEQLNNKEKSKFLNVSYFQLTSFPYNTLKLTFKERRLFTFSHLDYKYESELVNIPSIIESSMINYTIKELDIRFEMLNYLQNKEKDKKKLFLFGIGSNYTGIYSLNNDDNYKYSRFLESEIGFDVIFNQIITILNQHKEEIEMIFKGNSNSIYNKFHILNESFECFSKENKENNENESNTYILFIDFLNEIHKESLTYNKKDYYFYDFSILYSKGLDDTIMYFESNLLKYLKSNIHQSNQVTREYDKTVPISLELKEDYIRFIYFLQGLSIILSSKIEFYLNKFINQIRNHIDFHSHIHQKEYFSYDDNNDEIYLLNKNFEEGVELEINEMSEIKVVITGIYFKIIDIRTKIISILDEYNISYTYYIKDEEILDLIFNNETKSIYI